MFFRRGNCWHDDGNNTRIEHGVKIGDYFSDVLRACGKYFVRFCIAGEESIAAGDGAGRADYNRVR